MNGYYQGNNTVAWKEKEEKNQSRRMKTLNGESLNTEFILEAYRTLYPQ